MNKFKKAQDWLDKVASEAKFFRAKKVLNLEVVDKILDELGRPDKYCNYRVVVGGTAGKGTVCRLIEDVLIRNDKKVTTLISPHIQVVTERIRINGKLISKNDFGEMILKIKEISDKLNVHPTYYESIILAGILVAKENKSDVLICEVGLGGEFDAVNAVQGKRIAVMTFAGADHLEILGPKISDVARTKAGIFTKDSVLNLSSEQKYNRVLDEVAKSKVEYVKGIKSKLDKKLARKVAEKILNTKEFKMNKVKVPARWEKIKVSEFSESVKYFENYKDSKTNIFLEGAHSAPRFEFILPKLKKVKNTKVAIFAMAKNHDAKAFSIISDQFDKVYWTEVKSIRDFWKISELREIFDFGNDNFFNSKDALKNALINYPNANIFVLGSFYLCGEIRDLFYSNEEILEKQDEFLI